MTFDNFVKSKNCLLQTYSGTNTHPNEIELNETPTSHHIKLMKKLYDVNIKYINIKFLEENRYDCM